MSKRTIVSEKLMRNSFSLLGERVRLRGWPDFPLTLALSPDGRGKNAAFTKALLLLALALMLGVSPVFATSAIPEEYAKYPVMISLDTGGSASGFYFHDNQRGIYFVTAGHVLFERDPQSLLEKPRAMRALLLSYPAEDADSPIFMELDLAKLWRQGALIRHKTQDVVLVRLGTIATDGAVREIALTDGVLRKAFSGQEMTGTILGANPDMIKKFGDIFVGNEVLLFGYPTSLGIENYPQIDYRRPLLRKGIVAGKNEERKTIILDSATHYGNSGGPVIEVEHQNLTETRFSIIGMVVEYIPVTASDTYGKKKRVKITRTENSGYSVVLPMDVILEMIEADRSEATRSGGPAAPDQKQVQVLEV